MRRATFTAAVTSAVLALAVPGVLSAAPAAAVPANDGLTAATALASCWDVKQVNPAAASGVYWLYTPTLGYPQQFCCDQSTDGGGWVLIGRGRQAWAFLQEGQGRTADVSTVITGPDAFLPKMLTGAVVDGLLDGGTVEALTDGIRVHRAANIAGTTWNEVALHPSRFGRWHWALNGGYPLTNSVVNGYTFSGGTTGYAYGVGGLYTVNTTKTAGNSYLPGFGYDTNIVGSNAATSYLWSPTNGGGAIPFAQVFLRPKLRLSDLTFASVAAGAAAVAVTPMARNMAEPQPAGVSGLANGLSTERDTEVRAFARIGTTMYVGGNFAQVDVYSPAATHAQSYLAAFDVNSGAWLPAFHPVLNGKVNALLALPNGRLAVGGEFTTVNGVTQGGFVALDAATGATTPMRVTLQQRTSSSGTTVITPGTVTGLALQNSLLYLGGRFTHVSGNGTGFVYAKAGARINPATGQPDSRWNPAFDGTPIFVAGSQDGTRIYYGGFMNTMNDGKNSAVRFVAVGTGTLATPVTGLTNWVASTDPKPRQYQQTGLEVGNRFWLGGAEHSFFMYDRSNMALLRGNVTRNDQGKGGDFQASAVDGNVIYGSCHCILSQNYGDGRTWPTPTTFDDIGSVRYIGAYDATTGRQLDGFLPQMTTRAVRGPWALLVDQNGCLWAGGDTLRTRSTTGLWQSSGGFSRFCHSDATPPAAPTAIVATANLDGSVHVRWTGSGEAAGLQYDVYAGDHVVRTTSWGTGTVWSVDLPSTLAGLTYTVRARDHYTNLSAIPTPVTTTP